MHFLIIPVLKQLFGGRTRFHSVQNGLQLINEESIIFVHDAVRCLVSVDLVHRCYDAALEKWLRYSCNCLQG